VADRVGGSAAERADGAGEPDFDDLIIEVEPLLAIEAAPDGTEYNRPRFQLGQLFDKLDAKNRNDVLCRAREAGWLDRD
jgi:hypothetical protein